MRISARSPGRAHSESGPVRIPFLKMFLIASFALPMPAAAEEDGNELLEFMRKPALRDVAMTYVDAARVEWNGRLFCIEGDDPKAMAFEAVRQYLETHPDELFRPRRYLVIQGLRTGYPCRPS